MEQQIPENQITEQKIENDQWNIIFVGMWNNFETDKFLKTLLLPPDVEKWNHVSIENYIKNTNQNIKLLVCASFECDKVFSFLTKHYHKFTTIPKLLMNGENWATGTRLNFFKKILPLFDYVIDFVRYTNIPQRKYNNPRSNTITQSIQFPAWFWTIDEPIHNKIEWEMDNNPVSRVNAKWQASKNRPVKFLASCVASHDRYNTRTPIIREMKKYGEVRCPGKLMNNTSPIEGKFLAKINYIADGLYNICSEQSTSLNYVTEKIYNALEAGCIPIYWCGNFRPEWIHTDAYIYIPNLEDKTVTDTIKNNLGNSIELDKSKLKPFQLDTPFKSGARWKIADCFYQLQFLFYKPVILALASPSVIEVTDFDCLLKEFKNYPLGTQFTWGQTAEWKYLNWMGIQITETININHDTMSETEIKTLIYEKLKVAPSCVLHKNHFTNELLNFI